MSTAEFIRYVVCFYLKCLKRNFIQNRITKNLSVYFQVTNAFSTFILYTERTAKQAFQLTEFSDRDNTPESAREFFTRHYSAHLIFPVRYILVTCKNEKRPLLSYRKMKEPFWHSVGCSLKGYFIILFVAASETSE